MAHTSASEFYRNFRMKQSARREELLKEMKLNLSVMPIVEDDGTVTEIEMADSMPPKPAVTRWLELSNSDTALDDESDPYALEAQRHMRELEKGQSLSGNYMEMQTDVNAQMRTILVDWIVDVAQEYSLSDETLHLAVHYIDSFLSLVPVRRSKLQLVGVTCLFIAAKYEETNAPSVSEFVYITDNAYQSADVLKMEGLILSTLRFKLSIATSSSFLTRFYNQLSEPAVTERDLARYYLELALQDLPCLRFLPSVLAASALCLARIVYLHAEEGEDSSLEDDDDCSDYPEYLEDAMNRLSFTGYEEEDLMLCIKQLVALADEAPRANTLASYTNFSQMDHLSPSLLRPPASLVSYGDYWRDQNGCSSPCQ